LPHRTTLDASRRIRHRIAPTTQEQVMRRAMRAAMVAIGLLGAAVAQAAPQPVQVMVLGSYHFGNPGMDINNMKADSVLTAQRQRELDRVAKALLRFKPTHVMVEMESSAPDLAVVEYARFDDAMLGKVPNEIVQIGYRTARLAGLKTVHGIDEQSGDGEPDYFPYDKLQATAAKLGKTAELTALNAPVAAWSKQFEAAQKASSMGQMLVRMNDMNGLQGSMDHYYGALGFGDATTQTGADFNAMWYLRNAKIFAKLMLVAKPGATESPRVLVVYGGGHLFWLRHFARLTPGYQDVDVMPYLKKAG
jgi:hypothetical protein